MENKTAYGLLQRLLEIVSKWDVSQKVRNLVGELLQEMYPSSDMEWFDEDTDIQVKPIRHVAVLMMPDHNDSLFWNIKRNRIGGCDSIEIEGVFAIGCLDVPGLKEWYNDWEEGITNSRKCWSNAQWKSWWSTGLELAREVRKKLPQNVTLYYFTLNDQVWLIRPSDTVGYGLFSTGVPVRV